MANAGSFKKGEKRPGQGKRGPGKATTAAREAIASFVEANTPRLQAWLDQIAKKEPEKAFNMVLALIEFHVPKLQRQEVTGADGQPLQFVVTGSHVRGL